MPHELESAVAKNRGDRTTGEVAERVRGITADVRARGDAAVRGYPVPVGAAAVGRVVGGRGRPDCWGDLRAWRDGGDRFDWIDWIDWIDDVTGAHQEQPA
jgi:hypothetical protein